MSHTKKMLYAETLKRCVLSWQKSGLQQCKKSFPISVKVKLLYKIQYLQLLDVVIMQGNC